MDDVTWLKQPSYRKKKMSHESGEFFAGNRAAQTPSQDITGQWGDAMSPISEEEPPLCTLVLNSFDVKTESGSLKSQFSHGWEPHAGYQ